MNDFVSMNNLVIQLSRLAVQICQLLALCVIFTGIIKGLIIFIRNGFSLTTSAQAFFECRLQMGYSFSLGLNFLIGASILKTTITPQWEDIGRLAAIIVIRTTLNYLLLQTITKSTSINSPPELNNQNSISSTENKKQAIMEN